MRRFQEVNKQPKLLKSYKNTGIFVQKRAKFVFYMCIAAIVITLFMLAKNTINEITGNLDGILSVPMLISIISGVLLYLLALFLLLKGNYNFSVIIIITVTLIIVWIDLITSDKLSIVRIDGIAYLFVVLSMTHLMVKYGKYLSLLYSALCIAVLIAFVITNQDEIGIHGRELVDYLINTSIAFFLFGFLSYHFHSLIFLKPDYNTINCKEKQDAVIALSKSEKRYKEMTDLLPQIVAEVKSNGDVSYLNKAGYEKLEISDEDFQRGINIFSLLLEKDILNTNIEKIKKGVRTGNRYTVIKKNGETIPVQIYSAEIVDDGESIGFRSIIIDISENIKIEQALIASEKKYKETLLMLPQIVYESDLSGNLTYINKAGADMFGPDDLKNGLHVLDTMIPEDHERVKENIQKVLKGEPSLGNQYTGKRKDGSTYPMQVFSSPILDNGKLMGFRGIIYDLTEIKKVENDLRQSNELFRTFIELTPVSTTLSDMNGKFLLVNKAFCTDLGIKPEDALGKTIDDLGVVTEGGKEFIIKNILKEKGVVENYEISSISKNGKKHELYIYAVLVTINNQKVLLRSNVNVTDKKRLENKLRESEALFRNMVDMVPYSILIFGADKRLKFANRAYMERFNVTLDQVKGKLDVEMDFMINKEDLQEIYRNISEKKRVLNKEIGISHPLKGNIYTLLSYQSVIIDEYQHYLITAVDITKIKLLEQQLKEYNEQLEIIVKERTEELETINEELTISNEELFEKGEIIIAKNKELENTLKHLKETQIQLLQAEKMASLGVLTAGVAHEVNNPLNFLMGAYVGLENYFEDYGKYDEKKIDLLLNSMHEGIERISNIVNGLNQFSRNSDSLDETCDIHLIIENCLTMLQNKLKHKVEVKKKYISKDITVKGNVGKLHQVFINIISNALHAIPDKGNIIITSDIVEKKAIIEISDDGIGIEEKNLSRITDPFFTTKAPGEGTGLGLSITQTIVNEHHGEMKFKSVVNKGTKVILAFPII